MGAHFCFGQGSMKSSLPLLSSHFQCLEEFPIDKLLAPLQFKSCLPSSTHPILGPGSRGHIDIVTIWHCTFKS